MKARMILSVFVLIVLSVFMLIPRVTQGVQPEPSVGCIESAIIHVNYGEHTLNCSIDTPSDRDSFEFNGTAGDNIRVIVDVTSSNFEPRLEIRDPDGTIILDKACNGSACTVREDLTLLLSGTYLMAVSDGSISRVGNYILQLEKFPPAFNPPGISYDNTLDDTIQHASDVDFFEFDGVAGTDIRVIVDVTSSNFEPRLEIRDPDGTIILDKACNGSACTVREDLTLLLSGTYLMVVSDGSISRVGNYQVNLQCVFGSCPSFVSSVPVCDIQMSQPSYIDGDTVTASVFRIANPSTDPVAVEWAVWLGIPSNHPVSIINLGATGTLVLPAGFDLDLGPINFFPAGVVPLGQYELSCRILDPVTKRQLALDVNPFTIE